LSAADFVEQVQNQRQNHTQDDTGGDWKIELKIFFLQMKVTGKVSQFIQEGNFFEKNEEKTHEKNSQSQQN
jgi:hypothetical protein